MPIYKTWSYDYADKCECSDDDRCGCTYPNNMERSYTANYTSVPCNAGVHVGDTAPNFTAPAVFADNSFTDEFHFLDYIVDSYALLVFYHADFSAVCPQEITDFNQAYEEFAERGVKVVAVSIDSLAAHKAWRNLSFAEGGVGQVLFPLVSDVSKKASTLYGVLDDNGFAKRSSFLIDRNFKIRYTAVYDAKIRRNMAETLRVVDALIELDKIECNGLDCWMRRAEKSFSGIYASQ